MFDSVAQQYSTRKRSRQTGREADRQEEKQTDRKRSKQTGKEADRQEESSATAHNG